MNTPSCKLLALLLSAALVLTLVPAAYAADDPGGMPTHLTFSEGGITVTAGGGDGYEIDGTALTITAPGSYTLSGACSDGRVTVKKGVTGVTLTLAGLDLTSPGTAPITCGKGSAVTLVAQEGTVNALADGERNNDETYPENTDAENAVVKCKDGSQVTLCGAGTLNITANGKNGVKSGATTDEDGEAWLLIRDLTLTVTAPVNDAINAEQSLTVESGALTVSAADDAIHCDRTLTVGAPDTAGPTIRVTECVEGLEGADLTVLSGDVEVHSEDDGLNAANSDLGDYPFTMTIAGGRVYVDTTAGDGLDSNGTLTVTGGTVEVYGCASGGNAPLDCDGAFTLTGGTVLAVGFGQMAQTPTVAGQPFVTFGAGGMGGGFGGGMTPPDGHPADGQTPPERPDGQAPADGQTPPELPQGGQRPGARPDGEGDSAFTLTAGDVLTVTDAAGTVLVSGEALREAGYVFFSSPALTEGEPYTLRVNDEAVSTSTAQVQGSDPGPGAAPGGRDPGGRMTQTLLDVAGGHWFAEPVRLAVAALRRAVGTLRWAVAAARRAP